MVAVSFAASVMVLSMTERISGLSGGALLF